MQQIKSIQIKSALKHIKNSLFANQ